MHKLFGDIFYEVDQGRAVYLPERSRPFHRQNGVLALTLAVKHYEICLNIINRYHKDRHYINWRLGSALYALSLMKEFEEKRQELLTRAVQTLKNEGRRNINAKQLLLQAKQELADVLIASADSFKREKNYKKAQASIQGVFDLRKVRGDNVKYSPKKLSDDFKALQVLEDAKQAADEIGEFFGGELAVPEGQLKEKNHNQIDSSL